MAKKRKKTLITQAEYARRRGVSAPRISHLVKAGVIILEDGKVDPAQADRAIEATINPAYEKRPGRPVSEGGSEATGGMSYKEAATKEKIWKAALAKMDAEEREGKLLDAEELQRELMALFATIKKRLRAIPSKTAPEVYGLAKAAKTQRAGCAKINRRLLAEIDDALLELSQWGADKKGRK